MCLLQCGCGMGKHNKIALYTCNPWENNNMDVRKNVREGWVG